MRRRRRTERRQGRSLYTSRWGLPATATQYRRSAPTYSLSIQGVSRDWAPASCGAATAAHRTGSPVRRPAVQEGASPGGCRRKGTGRAERFDHDLEHDCSRYAGEIAVIAATALAWIHGARDGIPAVACHGFTFSHYVAGIAAGGDGIPAVVKQLVAGPGRLPRRQRPAAGAQIDREEPEGEEPEDSRGWDLACMESTHRWPGLP